MRKIAFLEYVFMFDPSETWSHLSEFESFLSNSLKEVGMEAEIFNVVGGQTGRGVLYIKKIQSPAEPPLPQAGRPQTLKGKINEMREAKVTAPAKRFQAKKPEKKLRGFEKVMRKAGK